MKKKLRIITAVLAISFGVIFFILPGSILFVIGGLMLLSIDFPAARKWLKKCQNSMSRSARWLDRFLLTRKFR
ncbi:tellurium resistance protein TerC [Alteromonadaceae bacterium M269]|nr:tellurium resistance protein TerC [Alteromonadaceae bacterium M269]